MTGGGSSIPEVQRLLASLVASKPTGRIAEIGTGFGEGARAISAALAPGATFITVEPDPARFLRSREALGGSRAELVNARWEEVLPARSPFDLIFFDGGTSDEIADQLDQVIGMLAPGGVLVKDDLTPGRTADADPLRSALLGDRRLISVELPVTVQMAVIIATRRS